MNTAEQFRDKTSRRVLERENLFPKTEYLNVLTRFVLAFNRYTT